MPKASAVLPEIKRQLEMIKGIANGSVMPAHHEGRNPDFTLLVSNAKEIIRFCQRLLDGIEIYNQNQASETIIIKRW